MWRLLGAVLVLSVVNSQAQFEDQFLSWRRDVGANRGSVWPGGYQNVYPHNQRHVPKKTHKEEEAVTERDREPLEPHSNWAGRRTADTSDIEQIETVPELPETSDEDSRPDVDSMVPSLLGGLGGFSVNNGHNFFASAGFDFADNPLGLFSGILGRRQKWWQGPNVCVERKQIVDEEEKESDEENEETVRQMHHGSGIIVFNGDASFESCSETNNMYTCTKRKHSNGKSSAFTVTYKCCHGYRRNPSAISSSSSSAAVKGGKVALCEKVDMKPVMEIVEKDLGAAEFATLVREADLEDRVDQENITLFVPSDEAMRDYEKMTQNNQVDFDVRLLPEPNAQRRKRQIDNVPPKALVLGHIIPNLYDLNELTNEQILESDNENNTIRINIYPRPPASNSDEEEISGESQDDSLLTQRVVTANCAPITKGNLLTTKEGLVHGLDGILMPASENIFQLLEQHGEFTIFAMALRKTGLHEALMSDVDQDGDASSFTVFAPTDRAFESLDAGIRMKIVNGDSCTMNILKNHILPHTLCSAAVPRSGQVVSTHNMAKDVMTLKSTSMEPEGNTVQRKNRDSARVIRVNDDAAIEKSDIVAKNGVIHVLDKVMVPESARSIDNQLEKQNFTRFLELIESAGMRDFFAGLNNATVFAVADSALESEDFKSTFDEMLKDKEKAAEFLRYHVVTRKMPSCDMKDEEDLPTASKNGDKLRINLYSTLPMFRHTYNRATANCARILRHDLKSCEGTVHEVDRPLSPPNQTIWEAINSDPQYSILAKIATGTELEQIFKDANDSITLLAPNDEVFESLTEEDLNVLLEDKEAASETLKMHVLPEILCCTGIGHNVWPFLESVRSLTRPLNINRDPNTDEVYIGTTTVAQCDVMNINGVIHRVDKVMLPQRPKVRMPFFRQFMFY
ncbi:periostin [Ctenocephalides felis]|uniref:periostin n=1 Tax=Ctenocephalides felis TaxID=7515 RepID=UPI000E6E4A7D|nr:periostin [Ctenocephalides felis]